jgi:hypothetical protein
VRSALRRQGGSRCGPFPVQFCGLWQEGTEREYACIQLTSRQWFELTSPRYVRGKGPCTHEALAAIEKAPKLSKQTVTHWLCSLRQIAIALDKPPEMIQARWTAVRHPAGRLHHAPLGITAKTLANHKSNARAALVWFAGEHDVPVPGADFTVEWAGLRDRLDDRHHRSVLSSLMRYCSARGLEPAGVDETVIDAYMIYRAETTALATDAAARRSIARSWNVCIGLVEGWPAQRLIEPPVKAAEGPSWESFPEGLRNDVEAYLLGLTKPRKDHTGKRRAPCKPATLSVRRAMLERDDFGLIRFGIPKSVRF